MEKTRYSVQELLGKFGWWLYVRFYWRSNKRVQLLLDTDVRDNLGVYLREGHSKFKL